MKKFMCSLFGIVFIVSIIANLAMCECLRQTQEVRSDTVTIEKWDTITDTVPDIRYETITKVIRIPVTDTILKHDTVTNEITLEVVQRQYSDDSTYTAYVSGINIPPYPCLDSIMVRQRTIERTITNTVYKTKHWRYGIGASAGISLTTHKPDIIIGGFVGYSF